MLDRFVKNNDGIAVGKYAYLRALEFPRDVGHDVDCVSTADTDAETSEAAAVGGVRVGTDDEEAGESVVFEDDLFSTKYIFQGMLPNEPLTNKNFDKSEINNEKWYKQELLTW